ncbi:RagB/SusD family nutrient uptake outer membrane protein [Wenyingzhuangia marina]|uniref:Starch-binding associating with outer membrane n=1 Tax=Wenyingzhuangia marina TaxID=1195760 RepID=A0A1M5V345_9FLAO|nr:RagB/SusD family nutrient uptake outer membrane protein [Wenyingzhuangia marina]GGF74750.1 membrane protein [Wenyingzhuangia marina]SHH69659.1 Starch-binding associating with outer membrane [Wenyingzhuangia marina]
MKKTQKYILTIIGFFAIINLNSCEDYLDKVQESDGIQEEAILKDYVMFRQYEDGMYQDLLNYLSSSDYSFISALSDEGYVNSINWETMPIAQSGDWLRSYSTGQALQFFRVWGSWRSIRIANRVIELLPKLEGATDAQKDELKGQAHFMRAWYYYEMLKRQGGMPYITTAFSADDSTEEFALPRLSYHETALKIAADCDSAAVLLPERWNQQNLGRPEKGAAMAVKAAALLFSASPSNNPSDDQSKWELAAKASWDLLSDLGNYGNNRYSLVESNGTDKVTYKIPSIAGEKSIEYSSGFDSIFMYQPFHDEIIWENYAVSSGADNTHVVFTTRGLQYTNVIQGYSVNASFVDLFETKNGLAIGDDPDFDSQDPYINRDPRFYHSILFNGERWTSESDRYLELFDGGEERKSEPGYNQSGYMARKFWARNVDGFPGGISSPITHVIYFRLADILLQYAEAANEIGGPNYTLPGAAISAVEAVNIVRARVQMPPVNAMYLSDKNSFRERIKNERAVEFYLEGKRFFDLSRWGDAHKIEHKAYYADQFLENPAAPTGYDINRASTPFYIRTFEQKQYKWPIPLSDAFMFEEFKQNPGW